MFDKEIALDSLQKIKAMLIIRTYNGKVSWEYLTRFPITISKLSISALL